MSRPIRRCSRHQSDIDHAFIMVPASAVPRAIEECVKREVPVATIYTDGFAETGAEGRRRQEEIVEIARAGGVRILGPNCSGIYSTAPSCALSVNSAIEQPGDHPGPLAIISQSGSMTGGLVSRGLGRGVGFSRIVSIGNEADLGVGELVDLLVDDDETGAILLFIETIRDSPAAGGRRAAGRRSRQADHRLQARALRGRPGSRRVAHRRDGGCGRSGRRVLPRERDLARGQPRDSVRAAGAARRAAAGDAPPRRGDVDDRGWRRCRRRRPRHPGCRRRTPERGRHREARTGKGISITTGARHRPDPRRHTSGVYGPVLDELLASDHCDLVLAIAGSSAQFQPEIAVEPVISARHATASHWRCSSPPMPPSRCVCWARTASPASARPSHAPTRSGLGPAGRPPLPRSSPGLAAAWTVVAERVASGTGTTLNESDASAAFSALGIPFAPTQVIKDPGEPVDLTFPVVAKVLSADVPHKTDAGGVVLGMPDAEALKSAAATILERVRASQPTARIEGILVQQMESGTRGGDPGLPARSAGRTGRRARRGRECWRRSTGTSRCDWRRSASTRPET